jgi:hypothetical protein
MYVWAYIWICSSFGHSVRPNWAGADMAPVWVCVCMCGHTYGCVEVLCVYMYVCVGIHIDLWTGADMAPVWVCTYVYTYTCVGIM